MQQTRDEVAQNLGFASVEDAAQRLGYAAGQKHDQTVSKGYRLSVKTRARLLAEELGIYLEAQPGFIIAYQKGCRDARKARR